MVFCLWLDATGVDSLWSVKLLIWIGGMGKNIRTYADRKTDETLLAFGSHARADQNDMVQINFAERSFR